MTMSSVRHLTLSQNLIAKLDSEMPAVCAVLYQAVLLVLLHCLEESRNKDDNGHSLAGLYWVSQPTLSMVEDHCIMTSRPNSLADCHKATNCRRGP